MIEEVNTTLDRYIKEYGPAAGETGFERFAEEVLGIIPVADAEGVMTGGLDPWQRDVLRAVATGQPGVAISACHGPGKTFVAAVACVCRLVLTFPQHCVVTAPSKGQLEGALVKEVHIQISRLPEAIRDLFQINNLRIELKSAPKESWFEARTAREEKPEALQGVHCDGGWVLLVADEASGVHEKIFESAEGSMSGSFTTTLLLSNPTRSSGYFFDTFHKMSDMWRTFTISAFDSTRVTERFVEQIRRRYGEQSNAYRIRVMGLFPLSDLDTIIPYHTVDSARSRDIIVPKDLDVLWALDVARFGDDSNCLLKRSRIHVLPDIQSWRGMDLMETTGKVKAEWDGCPVGERPSEILVDEIGLGSGVVDRLRELGLPVRGINVSESASSKDAYPNLRSELWFRAGEWLMAKNRGLPGCDDNCRLMPGYDGEECIHERLARELVSVKFTYASGGQRKAETKKEMKKRGLSSPDVADAFCLSFASEPAGLLHGSTDGWGEVGWGQDVSRGFNRI